MYETRIFSFRQIFRFWQDVEVTGPPLSHLNSLPQPCRAPRAARAAAEHPLSREQPGGRAGPRDAQACRAARQKSGINACGLKPLRSWWLWPENRGGTPCWVRGLFGATKHLPLSYLPLCCLPSGPHGVSPDGEAGRDGEEGEGSEAGAQGPGLCRGTAGLLA